MAAREHPADKLFHSWAAWCYGGLGGLGSGSSMLAQLIEKKGEIYFGGSTGSSGPADGIEQAIEAAVMALAAKNLEQADVLRLEYSAGWWMVCQRCGIADYNPSDANQLDRARALGVAWRTYQWRLAKARQTVLDALEKKYAK